MLKKQVELRKIVPFYHPRGTSTISHLLYVDDIVIFANGEKAFFRAVSKVLKQYEEWSKQVVNKRKSSISFSKTVSSA